MPKYAYTILAAGWLFWLMPFLLAKRSSEPAKRLDRRARWGIVLVAVAYSLLWQGHFWGRFPRPRQGALSIVFFVPPRLLFLTRGPALRPPLRIHAGLRPRSQLLPL